MINRPHATRSSCTFSALGVPFAATVRSSRRSSQAVGGMSRIGAPV
jgi:hypothetical protein